MKRDSIQTEARRHIGTPYKHLGRSVGSALDCIGHLVTVCRAVNLEPQDLLVYSSTPDGVTLKRELDRQLVALPWPGELRPGCVVAIKLIREHQHVAFVCEERGRLTLCHTCHLTGKVCEHVLDARWRRRVTAVWDLPGVED